MVSPGAACTIAATISPVALSPGVMWKTRPVGPTCPSPPPLSPLPLPGALTLLLVPPQAASVSENAAHSAASPIFRRIDLHPPPPTPVRHPPSLQFPFSVYLGKTP